MASRTTKFKYGCCLTALFLCSPVYAEKVYYIGNFESARPSDVQNCGTLSNPCATLSYWTRFRRPAELDGCTPTSLCTIRFAPGTYVPESNYGCILAGPNQVYEGRTSKDEVLDDYSSVVIDLARVGRNKPCAARGVVALASDYTNFVIRDVRIVNAPKNGILLRAPAGSAPTVSNLTIDRVWVDEAKDGAAIHLENVFEESDDCVGTGRLLNGVSIVDSLVTNNHGVGGAISVGCATNVVVDRSEIRDSRGSRISLRTCEMNPVAPGCDDFDGIQFAGVVDGVIRDSVVTGSGEDNIDVGGHYRKSYRILVQRTYTGRAGRRSIKVSGGAYEVTFRNNVFVGSVAEFSQCTNNSVFENNTVWSGDAPAFQGWAYCKGCIVRNNILRNKGTAATVQVSTAWTNMTIEWNNNLIVNEGPGWVIREIRGPAKCDPKNCRSDCPEPWPAAQHVTKLSKSDLLQFQNKGYQGDWFGPGTGAKSIWGVPPKVINATSPDAGNLHLSPDDDVATDAGATLPGFFGDFDGDTRPRGAGWDIGFDEK